MAPYFQDVLHIIPIRILLITILFRKRRAAALIGYVTERVGGATAE
jgi:hypothetical protein